MDNLAATAECAPPLAGMKRCTKCGEEKAETEFYFKNKKKSDERSPSCKVCHARATKEREVRWIDVPGNRDRINATRRNHYKKNKSRLRAESMASYKKHREDRLVQRRRHYAENREELAAKALLSHKANYATARAWRAANPEKVRAYNQAYSRRHPGHHIPHRNARRARKLGVKCERIRPWVSHRLSKWQKGLCVYCRAPLASVINHQDHVICLSSGGEHSERNLQLLCQPCNNRKYTKHPLDFAAEMGIVKNPIYIPI